jgi:glycosyltransferase involved in cell wall biosynthesis
MSNLIKGISDYQHHVGGLLTRRAIQKSEGFRDAISLIDSCPLPTTLDLIFFLRSYRLSQLASKVLRRTFSKRMYRRFGSYDFSLVHSHYSYEIDKQAEAILEYLKVPMVWTVHAVPSGNHQVSQQLNRFNAISKRHQDSVSVVAVSEIVKKSVESFCPDVKVQLIYNAAEVDDFRYTDRLGFLRRQGIQHPKPFVVCSVGRLNPEKGIEYLIKAASKVVLENDDAIFIHLGEGHLRSKLLNLVEKRGLKDRFFLLGHKTDVARYLRISDLFILPSLNEAFGLSLLEALTLGLPSVVSNVGGIPEVTNPNCSIFVPAADDRSIAEAIIKLINEPGKLLHMGAEALEQSKKFSMNRMISDYRSLYKKRLEGTC